MTSELLTALIAAAVSLITVILTKSKCYRQQDSSGRWFHQWAFSERMPSKHSWTALREQEAAEAESDPERSRSASGGTDPHRGPHAREL